MITRDQALELLHKAETPPALMQHAIASEALMLALAKALGQDETVWALCGLLHDLDYPATAAQPERHGLALRELLPPDALPAEALQAIAAHNDEHTGHAPATAFDFALRAAESVTGIISAAALVRPDKMQGMAAKSIKKKMKDKAFAASVSRERIKECEQAGVPLDIFLALSIEAMQGQQA